MNVKKILTWAGVALLAFFLVSQPEQSAALVHNILAQLKGAGEAVITFVSSIFR
jgi:hypothetical protein